VHKVHAIKHNLQEIKQSFLTTKSTFPMCKFLKLIYLKSNKFGSFRVTAVYRVREGIDTIQNDFSHIWLSNFKNRISYFHNLQTSN